MAEKPRNPKEGVHFLPGGHYFWDRRERLWVALSYVAILGRFKTEKEARDAITAEAEKYRE